MPVMPKHDVRELNAIEQAEGAEVRGEGLTMNFQDGMKLSVSHRRLQTPICRLHAMHTRQLSHMQPH